MGKYRWDSETYTLYEYSEEHGCYLFCGKFPFSCNEREAIDEYEIEMCIGMED